jgi:aminoglycoside phosphotransferase (APT) family kinase protein
VSAAAVVQDALTALAPRLRPGAARITGLTRLTGGASQETWRFGIDVPGHPEEALILRRRAAREASAGGASVSLPDEAVLLRLAGAQGVPVPSVRHVCAAGDGLGEAIIVEHVAGETLGRRIVAGDAFGAVRPTLAAQCGTALARIHAVDCGLTPALRHLDAAATLSWYEQVFRGTEACRPVLELAFQVLAASVPAPVPATLVHGDFRNGNLMVDPVHGMTAVLDWELAHFGDRAEDIGWICVNSWRFGAVENAVGGFGSLDALLDAYGAAGGTPPSRDRVRYWQMLGSLKWAVMCLMMYDIFRTGADPSLERATIGRRVSECETDLLALLESAA